MKMIAKIVVSLVASLAIVLFCMELIVGPAALADVLGGAGGGGGVKLQATFPGIAQTGNVNVHGSLNIATNDPGTTLANCISNSFGYQSGVMYGGATLTSAIQFNGGFALWPYSACNNTTSSIPSVFDVRSGSSNQSTFHINWKNPTPATATTNYAQAEFSGCGNGALGQQAPCISMMSTNSPNTALYIGGNLAVASGTNKVIVTTGPTTVTSGSLFDVVNNGTLEASIDFAGAGTFTSGTFGAGGVTIGTSGTKISGSFRGTAVWNPGTILAGATATTNVTVAGAVTGADCIASVLSPAPLSGFPVQCIVTAANTCGLMIVNQSSGSVTFGSGTFACRVFNP